MRRWMPGRYALIAMLPLGVTLVAACGPAPSGSPAAPTAAATATGRPAPTTPPPSLTRPPTVTTAPAATATPAATARPAVTATGPVAVATVADPLLARAIAQAQADLLRRLGPSALAVTIKEAQAVEWPDGALGCPQPGMLYPQVITPGFLVVLETGGQTYRYHGDGSATMRLCETGNPTTIPQAPHQGAAGGGGAGGSAPSGGPLAVEIAAAKADLMQRVGTLKADEIRVVSATTVEWRDGSLGCPQPGMMYTMALVPGYQVVLEAGGKTYDYHGAQGRPPRLCEPPSGGVPPGGRVAPRP